MKKYSLLFLAIIASSLILCQTKKVKKKALNRSFLSLITSKFSKAKCENKKIPSAANHDSPIESFGYPDFDMNTKTMNLQPRVSLSFISGFRAPIKIGVYDYLIAGDSYELQAFFKCFKDYDVIGQYLNENGNWVENTGTIKIQLSNLRKGPKMTDSMFETIFSLGLDKITKFLDPQSMIGIPLFGSPRSLNDLDSILKAWNLAKKYLPIPDNLVKKIAEICVKKISVKEKVKAFVNLIKNEKNAISAAKNQWSGKNNVSRSLKVLVTLTMYSKPENNLRATYDTGKSKMSIREIGDAVNTFMTKMASR